MTDLTEARLHALMEAAAAHAGHEPASLEGRSWLPFTRRLWMKLLDVKKSGLSTARIRNWAPYACGDTRDALAELMGLTARMTCTEPYLT